MQVALNLIENILRRSTKEDRAGLGILALCEVGKVLVAELGDLEQATLCTNVGWGCGEDGVDDSSSSGSCDTVVVCLANTADGCDISLDEEVLSKVYTVLATHRFHELTVTYR